MYTTKKIAIIVYIFINISVNALSEDFYLKECLSPSSNIKSELLSVIEKAIISGSSMIETSVNYGTDMSASFLFQSSQKLQIIYKEFLRKGDINAFTELLQSVFLPLIEKYPELYRQKKIFLENLEIVFLKLKEEGLISSFNDKEVWYSLMFELYKIRFQNSKQKYRDKNSSDLKNILLNNEMPLWIQLKTIFLLKETDAYAPTESSILQKECLEFFKSLSEQEKDNELLNYEYVKSFIDFGLYNENTKSIESFINSHKDSPYALYLSLLTKKHDMEYYLPKSKDLMGKTISIEAFGFSVFNEYFQLLEKAVEKTKNPILIFNIMNLIEQRHDEINWQALQYSDEDSYNLYSLLYINIFKILEKSEKKYNEISLNGFIFSIQKHYLNSGKTTDYENFNKHFLNSICSSKEEIEAAQNIFELLKNTFDISKGKTTSYGILTRDEALFENYSKAIEILYNNKEKMKSFKSLDFIPFMFLDFHYQLKFYEYMIENNKPYALEYAKNCPFFVDFDELNELSQISTLQSLKVDIFDAFLNLKNTFKTYKESKEGNPSQAFAFFYEKLFLLNELERKNEINALSKSIGKSTTNVKEFNDANKKRLNSFKSSVGKLSESLITDNIDITKDGEEILKAAFLIFNNLNEGSSPLSFMMGFEFLTHQVINDESLYKDKKFSYDVLNNITLLIEEMIKRFSIATENVYHPAYTENIEMTISEFKYLHAKFLRQLAELSEDIDKKIEIYSETVEKLKTVHEKLYKKRFYNVHSKKLFIEKKPSFKGPSLSDQAKAEINLIQPVLDSLIKEQKLNKLKALTALPKDIENAIKKETEKIHPKRLNDKNVKEALTVLIKFKKQYDDLSYKIPESILNEALTLIIDPLATIIREKTYTEKNIGEFYKMIDECILFSPIAFSKIILSYNDADNISNFIFNGLNEGLNDKKRFKMILKSDYISAIITLSAELFHKFISEEKILELFKLIIRNLYTEHELRPRLENILKMYNKNEFSKLANEVMKTKKYYIELDSVLKRELPLISDIKEMEKYLDEFEINYFLNIYGINGKETRKIGNLGLKKNDLEFIIKECKSADKHKGHLTNILNNSLLLQANLTSYNSYVFENTFTKIIKNADDRLDFELLEGVWAHISTDLKKQGLKHKGDIALNKLIDMEASYFLNSEEYNGIFSTKEEWKNEISKAKRNKQNKDDFLFNSIFKPLYFKNKEFIYLTEEMFDKALKTRQLSMSDFLNAVKTVEIGMLKQLFPGLNSETIDNTLYIENHKKYNLIDALRKLTELYYTSLNERVILPEKHDKYGIKAITATLNERDDFLPSKLNLIIVKNEIMFLNDIYMLNNESNEELSLLIEKFKRGTITRNTLQESLLKLSLKVISNYYINLLKEKSPLIKDVLNIPEFNEYIQNEVINSAYDEFEIFDIERHFNNNLIFEKKYLDFILVELSHAIFSKYPYMPLYFIINETRSMNHISSSLSEYLSFLKEEAGVILKDGLSYYYDNDYNTIVFKLEADIKSETLIEHFSSLQNRKIIEDIISDAINNNIFKNIYIDTIDNPINKDEMNIASQFLSENLNAMVENITKRKELLNGTNLLLDTLAKGLKVEKIQTIFEKYFLFHAVFKRLLFEIANIKSEKLEIELKDIKNLSTIISELQNHIETENSFYFYSAVNSVLSKVLPNDTTLNITSKSHLFLSKVLQLLKSENIKEPLMIDYKPKAQKIAA